MGNAVICFLPLGTCHLVMTAVRQARRICGSSLQKGFSSAISATFIARLIKGCRGDVRARLPVLENLSTFNALTSILVGLTPLAGGFVLAQ
jgi:hypothetical protein